MLRVTILAAAVLAAGCASKPPYKCDASNVAQSITQMSHDLSDASEKIDAAPKGEGLDALLAYARARIEIIHGSTQMLVATSSAKEGNIEDACNTLLTVRQDPKFQGMFTPL